MRILAVDDDQMLLDLLVPSMAHMGYTDVDTALSAREAFDLIMNASQPYECILLDIQMPETDGIELCSMIRMLDDYKTTPIVMLTAMTDRAYIDKAFAAGAVDYITKPFDGLEVGTRLRIAQRMVEDRKAVTDKVFALNTLKTKVNEAYRFKRETAISIEDVPGVVDHLVLENYVLQLSRGQSFLSTAIGFRIVEFDRLFGSLSAPDLYYTLADVAEAISEQFRNSSFLMAYMGSGMYALVTSRGDPAIGPELQDAVQGAVDAMELSTEDGIPCEITVATGLPQTNSIFFGSSAMAMVHAALDDVRQREGRIPGFAFRRPSDDAARLDAHAERLSRMM
ncbi:PleD family two-component system response regulator [Tropicimonas sp. IMCC34011]|uniref:response regulator n=1 Tax=Tropicimonas sp. IMCC34011 TaxID=2248759 RepID=UPI0013003524|nr:response regulator [Tropicimonas sp. IMCC34011]